MAKLEKHVTTFPSDQMTAYQWLEDVMLAQRGTKKEFNPAWQAYKYMLNEKMYAYIGIDDRNGRPIITMKLEPMYSELLRWEFPDIVPGYYMNKKHWSSVYLDGSVPKAVLTEMLTASYRQLLASLSKKAQKDLLS